MPKVVWHFNKRKQLSHAFVICNWASLLQEMKDCHKQQIFLAYFQFAIYHLLGQLQNLLHALLQTIVRILHVGHLHSCSNFLL